MLSLVPLKAISSLVGNSNHDPKSMELPTLGASFDARIRQLERRPENRAGVALLA